MRKKIKKPRTTNIDNRGSVQGKSDSKFHQSFTKLLMGNSYGYKKLPPIGFMKPLYTINCGLAVSSRIPLGWELGGNYE